MRSLSTNTTCSRLGGIQNEAEAYDAGIEFPDQSGLTAKFRDIWDFPHQITEEQWQTIDALAPAARHFIETLRLIHTDERAAYIAFMTLRMIQIKRILKPTGSVYIHCDKDANSYLRLMMDAVFGRLCFRDELIWNRAAENLSRVSHRRASETILYYSRDPNKWTWNQQYYPHSQKQIERDYRFDDDDGRGRYKTSDCTNNAYRPNMIYEFRGITRQWRFAEETMERYEAEDRLVFSRRGLPRRKDYLGDSPGLRMTNVWSDIDVLASGDPERTGYPTQKPQALARRIIETSSNPGDLVLDCFAGCAYVPIAAELAGRRWIACDMSPRAWTVVRRQFEKQRNLGIATEGGRHDEDTWLRLDQSMNTIRVRGPNELPERLIEGEPIEASLIIPPKARIPAYGTGDQPTDLGGVRRRVGTGVLVLRSTTTTRQTCLAAWTTSSRTNGMVQTMTAGIVRSLAHHATATRATG